MLLPLTGPRESDFTDPLGLMSDCHRRVERFLQTLITLSAQENLEPSRRAALEVALRYFREAAPLHTLDEEESLFPRMRAAAGEELARAEARLQSLEADHARARAAHAEVEELAGRWLARGRLDPGRRQRLRERLEELRVLYGPHIEVEDREIFPLARRCLGPSDLLELGHEMARRRGLDPATLPRL